MAEDSEQADTDEDEIVVVTAEPPSVDTPSTFRLDRSTVEASGTRSAQDLLRSMPGVQLSQHGSEGKAAQFFVRGFDAAHGTDVTVGIDGLVLNEPSHIHGHGYADTGMIIPEALQDVQLRPGPFALDQGNLSTAGDVSFRLGVPDKQRGTRVGAAAGWPARSRLWGYVAPPDGDERDVLAAEVVADQGAFENRQTRRAGLLGQQTFGNWTVRGALQGADFGLPGAVPLRDLDAGVVERHETYSPETTGRTGQLWLGALHEDEGNQRRHRTSVDVRARQFDGRENFTGHLLDERRGDERREYQRGVKVVASHRTTMDLTDDWSGVGYVGGSFDWFRQFDDGIDEHATAHTRHRGGVGRQGNVYLAPGVEGFVGDHLDIEAGVRLEALAFDYREDEEVGGHTGSEVVGVMAPRAQMRWYPGRHWTLSASIGRGYRGPQARVFGDEEGVDFDVEADAAEAHPEVTFIDAGQLSVAVEPAETVQLSATGFGYLSGAEYIYDHVARTHFDIGPTRRIGAELAAQWMPHDRIRVRGHVTGVDARFVGDQTGERIPFVPPLEAGMMAFGEGPHGLFGGLQWRAAAARPLPFGAQAAGWNLVDAHLGWASGGWEVQLLIENLLNTEWHEGVYHFASNFERSSVDSTLPATHVVPGHPRLLRVQASYRW